MVDESFMCGKCIVRTLLLEQTHFSLLNIKMQASFIFISFTSWYYSFSFSYFHHSGFLLFLFNSLQDISFCIFLHYQRAKL